jgi:hypothetical protein
MTAAGKTEKFVPNIHEVNAARYPEERLRALIGDDSCDQGIRFNNAKSYEIAMAGLRLKRTRLLASQSADRTELLQANRTKFLEAAEQRRHWLNEYKNAEIQAETFMEAAE